MRIHYLISDKSKPTEFNPVEKQLILQPNLYQSSPISSGFSQNNKPKGPFQICAT
ncbi:hypothetical protein LEP1GSC021_4717 [Leptospira noguchii str. 1993005606]|uniref:Uncharacterized protein n=2 Tax=Leptospira noguchii TaxID=28182 RepID=M6YYX3_9LEPT|nr:hypothetical protein LEP1GSC035_3819 [Leptospira noguchii str. 2007001578]EMO91518.1 hypothetical protein LEP1GSC024_2630 [Leptospira noguchii str. 2001034031]EPE86542.1 hypothetical protein LEP1GSC021_4717 [Leptospira noguchii str. 1993005606]